MYNEVGSEFWKADTCCNYAATIEMPHQYFLSGRTALEFTIRDIKKTRVFEKVYLPSYCCHTMIQPFLENDVEVEFYNVDFINGKYTYEIDLNMRCDVVLIMQYFGFHNEYVYNNIRQLKDRGKVIIEDSTHSWFSENPYSFDSDYVIASFRKWTGLNCGAIAIKINSDFAVSIPNQTNTKYIYLRQQAMLLKKEYIEYGKGSKEVFLEIFNQAEKLIEKDYKNYILPDDVIKTIQMLDYEYIRYKRNYNANYLIKGLKFNNGIQSICELNKCDTPLFVPIIVRDNRRNELRQHLIRNKIYCPVHWPLSAVHDIKSTYLYDNSLSLICDQRYNIEDMNRIIYHINEIVGGVNFE